MVTFPNSKINLGLYIINKREDGFHNLETVFLPLAFTDVLELVKTENAEQPCALTVYGLPVEGDVENNLCVKAYYLLKKDFPQITSVHIHLLKNIFMGAGLGGGSADAAFTLKTLNDIFHLQLTDEALMNYALQLGSDCPFFILNKPCFATSRGENLSPVNLNFSGYKVLLVNPSIHINTGWAFKQIQPQKPASSLQESIQQPIENWKHLITNDFEGPVCKQHPVIQQIKNLLYINGSVYASMTGSGSTVYGLFPASVEIYKTAFSAWQVIETAIAN